jgi:hypothetical protein
VTSSEQLQKLREPHFLRPSFPSKREARSWRIRVEPSQKCVSDAPGTAVSEKFQVENAKNEH